ncbi:hypothetical protein HDU86_006646 [Geranomyces michiganensis]|nr:hypothetical protein HDU86_006646 [Geranomyces michiganensis]
MTVQLDFTAVVQAHAVLLAKLQEILTDLGWELAEIIGRGMGVEAMFAEEEKCGPEELLSAIADAANPREVALFSIELVTTLVSDVDESGEEDRNDSECDDVACIADNFTPSRRQLSTTADTLRKSAIFTAFLTMWASAMKRLKVARTDLYVDTAASTLQRGMSLLINLREQEDADMTPSQSESLSSGSLSTPRWRLLHHRLLALYVEILEALDAHRVSQAVGRPSTSFTDLLWLVIGYGFGPLAPPSAAYAEKAFRLLSAATKPIPLRSINACDTRRTEHALDDLVQSTVLYLAHSTAQPAAGAFLHFRELLARFDDAERVRLLELLMLDPLAPPTVRTAALAILKDNVHVYWDQPSPFSAHNIARTFVPALLNPSSPVYATDLSGTVTNLLVGTAVLDCVPVVMHALNLYLYILVRDKPASNVTRLWHPDHVAQTKVYFLEPLRERIITLLAVNKAPEEHSAVHAEDTDKTLALQMLLLVLDQIADRHSSGVGGSI